jgi:AraC family ethanolamine operon transcriptional activator
LFESPAPTQSLTPVDESVATGVATSAVVETDGYSRSVLGINIQAIRTGEGHGPTSISSEVGENYIATSIRSGFPLLTSTTIGDSLICAVTIRSAPPGARWCGIDLESGMVIVYGPQAEHTAINPEGSDFAFAVVEAEALERVASEMHLDLTPPPVGQAQILARSRTSQAFASTLAPHVELAMLHDRPHVGCTDILTSLAAAVSEQNPMHHVGASPYIDSRRVANTGMEYVDAIGRIPTIAELCFVTHVSERRLRDAFVIAYGQPPSRFLRSWGLNAARKMLLQPHDSATRTVSRTACNIGFTHLGRFAANYKEHFGESPSLTLKRSKLAAEGVPAL